MDAKTKAQNAWKNTYQTLVHKEYTPGYKKFLLTRLNDPNAFRQGSKADDYFCLWQAEDDLKLQYNYLKLALKHETEYTQTHPNASKYFLYLLQEADTSYMVFEGNVCYLIAVNQDFTALPWQMPRDLREMPLRP